MQVVIRAGGLGTRLWPWSRRAMPKQFQNLFGNSTMLVDTLRRVQSLVDSKDSLWVSVNHKLVATAQEQNPDFSLDHYIIEPEARNTGAAVCLEVCFLEKRIPLDSIIASLPSDDYISDEEAFLDLLRASEHFISENPQYIVAPAVRPDYPEVGYSYLKTGDRLDSGGKETMFAVADFVEKPNREYCKELIKDGLHYWHTGMYLWQLGRIIKLFEELQPEMIRLCRQIIALESGEKEKIAELFASIEKMSIEAAITHRVTTLAMSVSNRVGWSDVGKWPAVKRLSSADSMGNVVHGEALLHKTESSIVYNRESKKIVVLNNVKDIAVIETDDVLVISDLNATEDIKEILERLAQEGKEKYL